MTPAIDERSAARILDLSQPPRGSRSRAIACFAVILALAAHAALGRVSYAREASERGNLVFRRSLYAVADIAAGEALTEANIRSIRPGHGLAPKFLPELLGRRARGPIARGTALRWELVE